MSLEAARDLSILDFPRLLDEKLGLEWGDPSSSIFRLTGTGTTNKSVHIIRFAVADPLNKLLEPRTSSRTKQGTGRPLYMNVGSRALRLAISRPVPAQSFTTCMLLCRALSVGTVVYVTSAMLLEMERKSNTALVLRLRWY